CGGEKVGSRLRPRELLAAQAAHAEGRIGQPELVAAENAAVLAALDVQRAVGIGVFTDGEYRRWRYSSTLTDAVEGFVAVDVPQGGLDWRGKSGSGPAARPLAVGAEVRQSPPPDAPQAPLVER